jgi:phosphate transport system substrate-binding protein
VQLTKKRRLAWLSIIMAFVVLAAACGDDDDDTTSGGSSDTTAASSGGANIDYSVSGEITGSGSSFQDAYQQAAIEGFVEQASDANITYNAVGSGTGKQEFGQGLTDFAGTDSLVGDDDGVDEGSFQYVPITAAPITVSYNLSGVEELQLSPETLANIFDGDITSWGDPAIAEDNPDADLPDSDITVVHRSDGSGTTSRFTEFLETAAPDDWTLGHGDTVEWGANTQAGEKNTGVAQLISSTDGAIGYVDLSDADASGLVYASVKNAAGEFVQPTVEGAAAALEGTDVPDDLSIDPINAEGAESYPIVAPTFILVRTTYDDEGTAALVKSYAQYLVSDGQSLLEDLGFAPLPESIAGPTLDSIDQLGQQQAG